MKVSIKAARINAELTQAELAEAVGVSKKSVELWEKCKTRPTIDKVPKLCEAFGATYDDIDWTR